MLHACEVFAECQAVDLGPWGHLDPVLGKRASAEVYPLVVRFLAEQIRKRANEALSGDEVRRVQVVVRAEPRKAL